MWRRNKFTLTRFRGSSADAHPCISPIEFKFHVKTTYDNLAKIYTKYFGHMTQMAIYDKIF